MYSIKTLNKISPAGTDNFDKTKYQFVDENTAADAIMVRSASLHDMAFDTRLKAIARAGAGVNNIPVEKCSEQGIVVFNTPGANANAVKELVLAGILISARKVIPAIDWAKTLKGQGAEVGKLVEKGKGSFAGPEVAGKKLGVIGLGAIGVLVANTARHLGMQVYGYDPYLSVDTAWGLSREIIHAKSLREIYQNCDFITIHVPLTPETKDMINSESLESCKNGVRILNFARGDLVNSEDIIAAIGTGKVSAYVTDFPCDELIGVDGVIAIPHLGASTPESEDNCAKMAAMQLIDFLENGNIKNSVNLPTLQMERSGSCRIALIHKNVPTMITKISQAISDEGLNIDNLTNKSKKEYAYTVVDVDGHVSQALLAKLNEIENVVRVNLYR
ncbi:D-3-phosphoglycerate dehydrogenase [Hydrogenoanaerobacterium saccharovorans]|uniref:D-3-phosphoglycerate dehydrogenase n=1 Tax=Hydrogenoanaerobacterium saccharovorans TaxID=474960 RepID=A0A1H8BT62_9FIRM|nr:phosphoglycerate dehydrogenase [Hydrogenoanaerobacterium saccharovorans]RPF47244.1 D-3-phosphoglycerate dehydrogenase [Hydrogenoanaerobacterium saccharovorans]SEM86060.1 D-3-phosphoglycerate dehydrogenase [Hydrogenoanaerobacterium saccharovorans]